MTDTVTGIGTIGNITVIATADGDYADTQSLTSASAVGIAANITAGSSTKADKYSEMR